MCMFQNLPTAALRCSPPRVRVPWVRSTRNATEVLENESTLSDYCRNEVALLSGEGDIGEQQQE